MALIPLAEAVARITDSIAPLQEASLPLADVVGMSLSCALKATQTLPPFDNSAMDGYAVRAADTIGATETCACVLPIQGMVAAGHPAEQTLSAHSAMRIFTGAPMPADADAVVIQENTRANEKSVGIHKVAKPGDHVRYAGEDVKSGQLLLPKRHILGPGDIAMFVAQGHTHAKVVRRPRVGIIPTGDELVEAGTQPGPGQIANSNGIMIQSMCKALGMEPTLFPIVPDDQDALAKALLKASAHTDLILTIGGASVGDFDYVLSAIEQEGDIEFWKVAIKPGKPLAFGSIDRTPIIGLPGNPASAFVCFELFARPALLTMAGRSTKRPLIVSAKLQSPALKNGSREQFLRARLVEHKSQYLVEALSLQGSGQLSSMLDINALIKIPIGEGTIQAGENVSVIALDRYFQG
ncbi:MAG: molybdopterin molybdotransferase MoeA [Deltaproteobacteria bacterium]|nr:molybdopterin molybdotransferase MoeA [Deltaproteobacteria bacterium]MBT6431788.1 molybdopterin molybdotransferase MoeA [Deltaproteobacteria bacterium]